MEVDHDRHGLRVVCHTGVFGLQLKQRCCVHLHDVEEIYRIRLARERRSMEDSRMHPRPTPSSPPRTRSRVHDRECIVYDPSPSSRPVRRYKEIPPTTNKVRPYIV